MNLDNTLNLTKTMSNSKLNMNENTLQASALIDSMNRQGISLLGKSSSLPNLDRSQVKPYFMNIKFSKQSSRKPLLNGELNEYRFVASNLFPEFCTKNKK